MRPHTPDQQPFAALYPPEHAGFVLSVQPIRTESCYRHYLTTLIAEGLQYEEIQFFGEWSGQDVMDSRVPVGA